MVRRILTENYHDFLDKYENLNKYLPEPSARAQFHRRVNEHCTAALTELREIAESLPYKYGARTFAKPETKAFIKAVFESCLRGIEDNKRGNPKAPKLSKIEPIILDENLFRLAIEIAEECMNYANRLVDADYRMMVTGTSRTLFPEQTDLKLLTWLYYYHISKPDEKKVNAE